MKNKLVTNGPDKTYTQDCKIRKGYFDILENMEVQEELMEVQKECVPAHLDQMQQNPN